MDAVRIGMIGSGYMALTYAEALARHTTGARLVAIAGGRRAPGLAAEYAVDAEESVAALLARADIEAVILTTPDQVHCAQTLEAAHAGKHVLVEKPMAPTVAQCDQMIAVEDGRAAGTAVNEGHWSDSYTPMSSFQSCGFSRMNLAIISMHSAS